MEKKHEKKEDEQISKEETQLKCPACGQVTDRLFSSTYGPDGPHCFNCPQVDVRE